MPPPLPILRVRSRLPASASACSLLAALIVGAFLPGCRAVSPVPLDPAAHAAAFAARRGDEPEVALRMPASGALVLDLSDGIGPAEAEAIALVHNADLRVARLRAGVARADADAAGRWTDPVLGLDLTRITESVRRPWSIAAHLALTVPLSGLPDAERATAAAGAEVAAAEVLALEWETRIAVRRAFAERAALVGECHALSDLLARLGPLVAIAVRMEASGEVPRTEARLFRAEDRTRDAERRVAEARLVEADLALRRLLGLSPAAPVTFVATPAFPEAPDDRAGAAEAPRLRAVRLAYEGTERALDEAVRRGRGELSVSPGGGRDDGERESTLGLALPLPLFDGNARGVARALAERDVARAVAEATAEGLAAGQAAARARVSAAVALRGAIAAEIVPLTDANHDDAVAVARLGEVDTLVLLETLTRRHDARLRLVAAARDVALAALRVRELAGPPADPAPAPSGSAGGDLR